MYSLIPSFFGNSTDSNNYTTGLCDDLIAFAPAYIIAPISVLGILLNAANILVFHRTKTTTIKGDMTKYLICKSIFDICFNIRSVFPLLTFTCVDCDYTHSFCFQVLYLAIASYLKPVSLLCSIAFDFAATFDRYRLVTNKCKFFNKIFVFKRSMHMILSSSFVLYTRINLEFLKLFPIII